jgi:hypothetical protein
VPQRQQVAVHLGVKAGQVAQVAPLPAELLEEKTSQGQLQQHALVHRLAQHAAEEGQERGAVRAAGEGGGAGVQLALRRGREEAVL